jgi:class 3 adenylate cyclase
MIEDETGIANLFHQVRRQAASPLDRALPMEDMRNRPRCRRPSLAVRRWDCCRGGEAIGTKQHRHDAVRCAVVVQQGMEDRNANLPEAGRIRLRIGINLGDVMVDEGLARGGTVVLDHADREASEG